MCFGKAVVGCKSAPRGPLETDILGSGTSLTQRVLEETTFSKIMQQTLWAITTILNQDTVSGNVVDAIDSAQVDGTSRLHEHYRSDPQILRRPYIHDS